MRACPLNQVVFCRGSSFTGCFTAQPLRSLPASSPAPWSSDVSRCPTFTGTRPPRSLPVCCVPLLLPHTSPWGPHAEEEGARGSFPISTQPPSVQGDAAHHPATRPPPLAPPLKPVASRTPGSSQYLLRQLPPVSPRTRMVPGCLSGRKEPRTGHTGRTLVAHLWI